MTANNNLITNANFSFVNSNNITVSSSGLNNSYIYWNGSANSVCFGDNTTYVNSIQTELNFKIFVSDDESYYELCFDGDIIPLPDDVNFDSIDDIFDVIMEQSGESINSRIPKAIYHEEDENQEQYDPDITFKFEINRNKVVENKEIVIKLSILTTEYLP